MGCTVNAYTRIFPGTWSTNDLAHVDCSQDPECAGNGAGLIWNAGYPAALDGKTWTFLTSISSMEIYFDGIGDICEYFGGPEIGQPFQREYYNKVISSTRLFVCESGILIDKTSEAIQSWRLCIVGCAEQDGENLIINNCNTFDFLDFTYKMTYDLGATGSDNYVAIQYNDFSCDQWDGSGGGLWELEQTPVEMLDRPPFPNELGADITYICNDAITQDGCLQGGVLSPSGVPLGIWHNGQNCTTFNCNS